MFYYNTHSYFFEYIVPYSSSESPSAVASASILDLASNLASASAVTSALASIVALSLDSAYATETNSSSISSLAPFQ